MWTILLAVLFIGYVGNSLLNEQREPAQQSDAKAQASQHPLSDTSTAPELIPAEKFAVDLKQTLRTKYPDLDIGITDHVLTLISNSFRDEAAQESRAKEFLKNRDLLCEKGIWTVAIGYSRDAFSSDAMKTFSLGCPEDKAAYEQVVISRREKLATELSDSTMRVTTEGATIIFDSEQFSDFNARAAFVQAMESTPSYKKLLCGSEIARMQLTYRTKVMRTVPIACN